MSDLKQTAPAVPGAHPQRNFNLVEFSTRRRGTGAMVTLTNTRVPPHPRFSR